MEQAGVAGPHTRRHAQRVEQGFTVFQPVANFFQMGQRRRRQDQISPVQAGCHALGRQCIGLAAGRIKIEKREQCRHRLQAAGEDGFTGRRLQRQQDIAGKQRFAVGEQMDDAQAFGQRVAS